MSFFVLKAVILVEAFRRTEFVTEESRPLVCGTVQKFLHSATLQRTAFFIGTAMKTSNLTEFVTSQIFHIGPNTKSMRV
jgi:hypothetical protein